MPCFDSKIESKEIVNQRENSINKNVMDVAFITFYKMLKLVERVQ